MRGEATVNLRFSSEKQLQVVLEALKPETKTSPTRRSRVHVKGEEKGLTLNFEAADTSALRAAMNSYLRWICLTQTVLKSIDALQSKKSVLGEKP